MPDIPMTSKIARKPWSLFKLESAMTRFVSKTNTTPGSSSFLALGIAPRREKRRRGRARAGGCGTEMSDEVLGGRGGEDGDRDKERSIRRTTRWARRERKRERERQGERGRRRGETTQHHGTFFPMIVPPTDGHGRTDGMGEADGQVSAPSSGRRVTISLRRRRRRRRRRRHTV